MYRILLILFIPSLVFAQNEVEDVFEKNIFEIGFIQYNPIGLYQEQLKSSYTNSGSLGINAAYFMNPKYRKSDLSSVYLGLDVGIMGNRQSDFKTNTNNASFYAAYREMWLRPSLKYLPSILPNKLNASISLGIGPRSYKSRIMEQLADDQTSVFYKYGETKMSYYAELAAELKINQRKHPFTYVKFAVGFDKTNALKIWDRKNLGITNNFEVIDPKLGASPQYIYLKLSLLSYR